MRFLLGLTAAILIAGVTAEYGKIIDFQQKSNGDDYVELEWSLTASDYPIHKYTLVTDNDFSTDIRCHDSYCTEIVDYLAACSSHTFELTPHFDGPSGEYIGDSATTDGNTADKPPGAPSNIANAGEDGTGVTIAWDEPTENPDCVDKYRICVRLDGESVEDCFESETPTYKVSSMQACATYHVTVGALTASGASGPLGSTTIKTVDGNPGQPKNVVVALATADTIFIEWDDPDVNPLCVDRYAFSYGEVHTRKRVVHYLPREAQHHATISPLEGCTNYTIDVFAVNQGGLNGPAVTNYAQTEETEPLAPPTISVGASGAGSIDVIWGTNPDDKCAGRYHICWVDGIHLEEFCNNVDGGGNGGSGGGGGGGGGDGHYNMTINDLLPCSKYDIIITVETPSGNFVSVPISDSTHTDDVQPGPVVDLKISKVDASSLTISYEPPPIHPQCVKEYDTEFIDLDESAFAVQKQLVPYMDITATDLKACTNYKVRVRTVSPTNLRSTWEETDTKTTGAAPSEPRKLEARVPIEEDSITLSWWEPELNGRCTSKYVLEWEANGSKESVDIGDGSSLLPFEVLHTVTGLTACTEYTFTVTASSDSSGDSPPTTLKATTSCPTQ